MRILFQLGHPAHFHLFNNVMKTLINKGNVIFVLIKKKDVLEKLLIESKIEYHNILPEGRKDNKLSIAIGQIKQDARLLRFCIKKKPDILIGTSVAISHVGKLLGIPSINVNEDDAEVVPLYAKLAYPWATAIIVPSVCSTGKWDYKTIRYEGYHELAYLHPNVFAPDQAIAGKYVDLDKPFYLIRFAKLKAHHDVGIKGIHKELALKIIDELKSFGKIYITSERELEPEFEAYRANINPIHIHHVMAFATLYIGDSQTMAAEAGVLGTPFIRFNDFVGRISYLNELENKYHLGYGIKTRNPNHLIEKVRELASQKNVKEQFQLRRQKMLADKIDVSSFLFWFIENYPKSLNEIKLNPELQKNFK